MTWACCSLPSLSWCWAAQPSRRAAVVVVVGGGAVVLPLPQAVVSPINLPFAILYFLLT